MRTILALMLPLVAFAATPADVIQAIRNNDLATIRSIAPGGKEANAPIDRGTTPLMYAAGFGSLEAVRVLLAAGADVNAKNAFDATALMWGISNPAKVKVLIDKGADVNARAKSGVTPLLLAAQEGDSESIVKMLLAKGADLQAKDAAKNTLLVNATGANNTAVAKLAIAAGLDVNAANFVGFTPLMNASAAGNTELVKLLLARGANVNATSAPPFFPVKNGIVKTGSFTALMAAATSGPAELVKTLIEAGAKVDVTDARGMTALHFAVSSEAQDPAVVRILLAKQADPNSKMETGETPTDWALKFAKPEIVRQFSVVKAQRAQTAPAELIQASDAPVDLRAATQKSLALLQKTGNSFFLAGGCSSCHAQEITAMAVELGRRHGLVVDEAAATEQYHEIKAEWSKSMDTLMLRQDPPGGMDMLNYAMFGLAAAGHKPDTMTDAMVHDLAAMQASDGSWPFSFIARVPIEDSNFTKTAMSIRVLATYGPAGLQAEYSQRIDRAAKWLETHKPGWTEEQDMQLLGLKWAGAKPAALATMAHALMSSQRPDGGWAQNPYLESDAYATGEVLYALNQAAGLDTNDPVYQRGVAYLLRTQHADGSWHVKSRAVEFQPYFQSGFPYDHDQWISAQSTGWAAMALSLAIAPGQSVKHAD